MWPREGGTYFFGSEDRGKWNQYFVRPLAERIETGVILGLEVLVDPIFLWLQAKTLIWELWSWGECTKHCFGPGLREKKLIFVVLQAEGSVCNVLWGHWAVKRNSSCLRVGSSGGNETHIFEIARQNLFGGSWSWGKHTLHCLRSWGLREKKLMFVGKCTQSLGWVERMLL